MSSRTVGYIRVSSLFQNTERQLAGISLDKVFSDKASGKDVARPELMKMMEYVRDGDTVLIHSMDRLGRNMLDLQKLVRELTGRGVRIQFIKENLTFSPNDDNNPMSILLFQIMAAFSEFERAIIKERQREGIAIAKMKGNIYKGRKKLLSFNQVKDIKDRVQNGDKKAVIARDYKLSRQTLYQYLKSV
jgi:DNA invertase Pin-like site-specific DNA recombinase